MAELSLHAVQWCSQHGRPVLALRTSDDRFFIVALAAEDAVALAPIPDAADGGRPPRRLHRLIETAVAAFGARLTGVQLHVGRDDVLRASLLLHGPTGEIALPAHFADGVALAHRGRLPLRMADEDLVRVPLTPLATSATPAQIAPLPVPAPVAEPPRPPEAFRALIESLDFDHFGPRPGDDHSPGASNVA